jgi:CBS domain containing-hemolysin-like protein
VAVIATVVAILVVLVCILSAAVAAAADTALRRLPRQRVKRLAEAGARGSGALDVLSEREGRALSSAAFVGAFSLVTACAVLTWMLWVLYPAQLPVWADIIVGALIGLVLVFSLGEALPRAVALANPEGTALAVAGSARRLFAITNPLVRLLAAGWTRLVGLVRGESMPQVPWTAGTEEGPVLADEEETAESAEAEEAIAEAFSDFREKVVREVMVPRPDMVALEDTVTLAEALDTIRKNGYSRMPVYHDTLDDIRGVLYARDLLLALGPDGCTIAVPSELARPAYWVPETKPLESLLIEMRNRTHIAMVADEYGGTAGLVTIEDLLEEIVGEIFDEYDRQEQLVVELGEGRYRVDARLPVDDMNDLFGTAIELDADTVGGLVTELAGCIPSIGESVEIEGLRLIVDGLEGARVRALIVEPAPRAEKEGNGTDEHAHTT